MTFADRAPTQNADAISTDVSSVPPGGRDEGANVTSERGEMGSHVNQRAIVFEQFRILYVPVPKAGCTALLWSLAGLARLPEADFADSMGREVSRSMTIHAMGRWPESFRFGERPPEERERMLKEDGWLRFTVGRHPFRRLWSAWQSKVLLAEPQFVEKFSSEPWFPGPVGSASEILEAFRSFLDALRADPALIRSDVHWAPQTDVIEYSAIPYDHLGRVEDLDDTVALVRAHVSHSKGARLPDLPRANVTPLPYADELFTGEDVRFLEEVYADDMKLFGYDALRDDVVDRPVSQTWLARVDAVATALTEMRDRNQRVGDLHHLLRARRDDFYELRRQKKREEKLRREEHRRNQRLQRRLRRATKQIEWMESTITWRLTTPFRLVTKVVRRLGRILKEGR